MFIEAKTKSKETILCKYFVTAMNTTMQTVINLSKKHPEWDMKHINDMFQNYWNILAVIESPKTMRFGQAVLKENHYVTDFKYEARIYITSMLADRSMKGKALNTFAHEIFHVIAMQIERKDVAHDGLWKELVDQYNKDNPKFVPITQYGYLDELLTKEQLKARDKEIKEYNKTLPFKYEVYCPECRMVYGRYKIKTHDVKHYYEMKCHKCEEHLELRQIHS